MLPKRTRSGVLISTLPRNRDEKKQGSFLSYPFNFSGPFRFTNGKEVLANKAANFRATWGNPNSGIRGNFCLWNPKSWSLESGIQLKESGIPLTNKAGSNCKHCKAFWARKRVRTLRDDATMDNILTWRLFSYWVFYLQVVAEINKR